MKELLKRYRELKEMSDEALAQIYCNVSGQDDVEKYEWRVFQDRREYIREILSYEMAG